MNWFEVAAEAEPYLHRNDHDRCESIVREALIACPISPFHAVLDLDFTNDVVATADQFTRFFERGAAGGEIAAIYTETNGFDINPDRWYFDIFGYFEDGGLDDLDWLAEWVTEPWPGITLTGMEKLQAVYASEALGTDQAYLSSLMVVVKFQRMIHKARSHMKIGDIPVYVTGHDYNFIGRC